jgi:hypothetical protein
MDVAFSYFRSGISVVLIGIICFYTARAAGLHLGKAGTAALFLPAAATLASVVAAYAGGSVALSIAANISFNSFIAVVSFLVLSSAIYAFFVALAILMTAGVIELGNPLIPVGVNGLFCFAWGFLLLASALKRSSPARGPAGKAHPRFLADFPFSPREAELLELVNKARAYEEAPTQSLRNP